MVSPQVSREIAGHISQAMQDRYSIQRFDTKKAALDALEDPPQRVPEPGPPASPASWIDPAIQAEIARQVAIALEERDRQQHEPAARPSHFPQTNYDRRQAVRR